MWRPAIYAASLTLLMVNCPAWAHETVHPGQWGLSTFQQICLKDDGTWYGTTFNFDGTWTTQFVPDISAAMVSNYNVHAEAGVEHANDTITVTKSGTAFFVSWYDWYDDLSYGTFLVGNFTFLKGNCDPPFKGKNTHAATQSAL